jgi:hypothetical protein
LPKLRASNPSFTNLRISLIMGQNIRIYANKIIARCR